MSLRLLDVCGVSETKDDIEKLLEDITIYGAWQVQQPEKEAIVRLLVDAEQTEHALDVLEEHFSKAENFRVIVLPVEASVPRAEKEKIDEKEEKTKERISIEEIYQDISEEVTFSKTYFILIILASVVAAIGLLYNNVAVIIGSMVIAPLLAPNMALSLSTTLADGKLGRNALLTSGIGYTSAFAVAIIFGLLFAVDPNTPEIFFRTDINLMYVLLAFSAGTAGSLSLTKGVSQALVGVMVAVAILPPIVASGLLFGAYYWMEALGAFLLFSVNIVCINLAGVVTFLAQGITPRRWWEKQKAKKIVWKAMLLWVILLAVLIGMIIFYRWYLQI